MLMFDICNKYAIDEPLIRALQKKKIEKLICHVRVFEIDGVVALQTIIRWVTYLLSHVITIVGGAKPNSGDGVDSCVCYYRNIGRKYLFYNPK